MPRQAEKSSANTEAFDDAVIKKEITLSKEDRDKLFAAKSHSENIMFIQNIILAILNARGLTKTLYPMQILRIFYIARQIFEEQGRMVELEGPVRVCGDIHGQYGDLIRIFNFCGFPPDSNYLFLGDYVDRGRHSMEVLILCLAYEIRYSNNFFMLRGKALGFEPNKDRGGNALTFGSDVLDEFLEILGVDMIIRGHQVVQDGYAFNAGRKCVTVFLAAYYLGQFDNAAGVCFVSEGLEVSFEQLKPETLKHDKSNNP
ncbi:unnamed protein product [Caenorhabditis angaria]|uniref:Serine/threonine specific protein phosphatases domain-containing protein n=1 Tax=Caenorhabditis angaria TaxID=860376 RepID=A0A9P1IJT9_9PELO|nr:unnamed protein product [Caenorhabditis angaria]